MARSSVLEDLVALPSIAVPVVANQQLAALTGQSAISRQVILIVLPFVAAAIYFGALNLVPSIYPALLFADLWFFAYAHVAASLYECLTCQ